MLMRRLGNRKTPGLRSACLDEMILVQREELEMMERLPDFIISEEATAETIAGDSRLPLPSDFLREVEDDNLWYVQDDGTLVEIPKRGYDEGRLEISDNAEAGPPQLYSVRGNYIILRPTPDAVYQIRFPSYYARQDEPADTEGSENQWFKFVPSLLIAKTGVKIAGLNLKDPELVQIFAAEQDRGITRLKNYITAREEANRNRRMG